VHLLSQSRVRIASCDAAFERATQACGTGWPAPVVTSGVIRLAFRLVRWIHKRAGNVGFRGNSGRGLGIAGGPQ
jgi:hypothetical protein